MSSDFNDDIGAVPISLNNDLHSVITANEFHIGGTVGVNLSIANHTGKKIHVRTRLGFTYSIRSTPSDKHSNALVVKFLSMVARHAVDDGAFVNMIDNHADKESVANAKSQSGGGAGYGGTMVIKGDSISESDLYYHEQLDVFISYKQIGSVRFPGMRDVMNAAINKYDAGVRIHICDRQGNVGRRYVNMGGVVLPITPAPISGLEEGCYVEISDGDETTLNGPYEVPIALEPFKAGEVHLYPTAESATSFGVSDHALQIRLKELDRDIVAHKEAELNAKAKLSELSVVHDRATQKLKADAVAYKNVVEKEKADLEIRHKTQLNDMDMEIKKQARDLDQEKENRVKEMQRYKDEVEAEALGRKDYYEDRSHRRKDVSESVKIMPAILGLAIGVLGATVAKK